MVGRMAVASRLRWWSARTARSTRRFRSVFRSSSSASTDACSWADGCTARSERRARSQTYAVTIPTSGVYSFETSGAIGSCGFALELNTAIAVTDAHGTLVGSNDNTSSTTGHMTFPGQLCSYVSAQLSAGTYTVEVTGGGGSAGGAGSLQSRHVPTAGAQRHVRRCV